MGMARDICAVALRRKLHTRAACGTPASGGDNSAPDDPRAIPAGAGAAGVAQMGRECGRALSVRFIRAVWSFADWSATRAVRALGYADLE